MGDKCLWLHCQISLKYFSQQVDFPSETQLIHDGSSNNDRRRLGVEDNQPQVSLSIESH